MLEAGLPKILEHIESNRDSIVALLQKLIRFESITGSEAEIGQFVANFCRDTLGLPVEIVEGAPGRPNVLARWNTGRQGPTLLLNDHLDIVPPGPLEYWSSPPFAAEIRNGRVIGRGAIDTKSGLTTLLAATHAIRDSGVSVCGALHLVFTCDEEVGGALGAQLLGERGHLKAEMALVAEPTSLQVEIATKGRLHLELVTEGLATHAARPWLGRSAIDDMVAVLAELQEHAVELGARSDPLLGRATLCVGTIQGGTVPNMVPNRCAANIDRRVLPHENAEEAVAELEAVLDRVRRQRPGLQATLHRRLWWPGYQVAADAPVVRRMSAAFEAVVGKPPVIAGKDAGTDASWIHKLGGTPVVMFSPGHGPGAMNADESVAIEDLIIATKVVAAFILDVLAGGIDS